MVLQQPVNYDSGMLTADIGMTAELQLIRGDDGTSAQRAVPLIPSRSPAFIPLSASNIPVSQ
jgi:hypothetical protein